MQKSMQNPSRVESFTGCCHAAIVCRSGPLWRLPLPSEPGFQRLPAFAVAPLQTASKGIPPPSPVICPALATRRWKGWTWPLASHSGACTLVPKNKPHFGQRLTFTPLHTVGVSASPALEVTSH